jgi:hypothetical protein
MWAKSYRKGRWQPLVSLAGPCQASYDMFPVFFRR